MARARYRLSRCVRRFGVPVVAVLTVLLVAPALASAARFSGPTTSSPIVLSQDGRLVWVVNPGGDNVALLDARDNRVLSRIRVGDEPESVAVDPNNRYAYVANAA